MTKPIYPGDVVMSVKNPTFKVLEVRSNGKLLIQASGDFYAHQADAASYFVVPRAALSRATGETTEGV